MSVQNYNELADHYGHDVEIAMYGEGVNIAVECIECNEVLLDYDREEA